MTESPGQDKGREVELFDSHAREGAYDVFSPGSSRRLIRRLVSLAGLKPPATVADLGCASGAFSALLREEGFDVTGVDISPEMIALAARTHPECRFMVGDVEALPFPDAAFDAVLLGGVIHHFPDPARFLREAHRVLKPGGRFMAFDPNRMHPVMYLYRDRSSPFYSSKGVTANERPVIASAVSSALRTAGFDVWVDYLGLNYGYVASPLMRLLLPVYNAVDSVLFLPPFLKRFRSFVLTVGRRAEGPGARLCAPPAGLS